MKDGSAATDARSTVEQVARTSYGRLVAFLAGSNGDIAAAEDALGEALLAALVTWPQRGVPDRPETWLLTASRRKLIDTARQRGTATRALPELARLLEQRDRAPEAVPDDRLRLMFACTHPSIAQDMRSPLMLQVVLGLDASVVASAYLLAPTTMGQRLVRAKAKIKAAGVPFTVPAREQLPERLGAVLGAVYAAYGTGWDDRDRGDLTGEALRLSRLVAGLLPGEPEALGLLALLLHLQARVPASRSDGFVPLEEQDVALWDGALAAEAERVLARAQAAGRFGPYQLLAAISSVHAHRAVTGRTEWPALLVLYDELVVLQPVVGVYVARSAALRQVHGAASALAALDELPGGAVSGYQPYWVLRARCLSDLGLDPRAAVGAAIALTVDPAVRRYLQGRAFGDVDRTAGSPSVSAGPDDGRSAR